MYEGECVLYTVRERDRERDHETDVRGRREREINHEAEIYKGGE